MAGGYSFAPMMTRYCRIISASTVYLMEAGGRKMIADAIRYCRRVHGKAKAVEFHDALITNGAIYPLLRSKRPVS